MESRTAGHAPAASAILFQPIVELPTANVIGYEALARFGDGRGPAEWLAEANAAGRLAELELSLVDQVLATAGMIPDGKLLTFNISGVTLDRLTRSTCRLDRRLRWGVELNEWSTDEESARARAKCDELECLLLLDDAGSAYTTPDRVCSANPDMVKIDRSFFCSSGGEGPASQELKALVAAARDVGATVIAEGVETLEDEELARSLSIELAQGFRYGRPQ